MIITETEHQLSLALFFNRKKLLKKVIWVTFVIFILCDMRVAYATALKEQPSKCIKEPETY